MASDADIITKLAKIEVTTEFIKEKVEKIESKIEEFDHCTTELECKVDSHINNTNDEKKWKRRLIIALIGVAGGIVATLLSIFL